MYLVIKELSLGISYSKLVFLSALYVSLLLIFIKTVSAFLISLLLRMFHDVFQFGVLAPCVIKYDS